LLIAIDARHAFFAAVAAIAMTFHADIYYFIAHFFHAAITIDAAISLITLPCLPYY